MTMLTALGNIGIADAGIVALLGYATVFAGLIALMIVVTLIGKIFSGKKTVAKEAAPAVQPQPAVEAVPAAQPVAPGTAGELKLHDVPPKTAAMLMAIVANQMDKPLNELRFISIKEVK